MTIAKITRAYVRRYRDNGQVTAYVEWIDGRGKSGRTEGPAQRVGAKYHRYFGSHMHALVRRAMREGLRLQRETW